MLELNFNPFPALETDRLILRKITLNDAENLLLMREKNEVMQYIQKPLAKSIDEVKEFITKLNDGIEQNESIAWGISFREQPGLIGTISFNQIEKEHSRAEIGYMLNPAFWNIGIMNEAIKKVLEFGFDTMHLHSIEAKLHPGNIQSIRLLKKNGFCKEAYFKENYFFEGFFFDTEIYSLLQKKHEASG